MSNRAKYVRPKSPERQRFEQSSAAPPAKPAKVTNEMLYEQNRQILENQKYIISLLTRRRP